jgi:hypothetical protein
MTEDAKATKRELSMSDGATILLTTASTTIGAFVSWWITRRYYHRSGKDLEAALRPLAGDNQALIRSANAIARMIEQADLGKGAYDSAGNLTGVTLTVCAGDTVKVTDVATAVVERGQPARYDRQHEQPDDHQAL